MIDLSPFPAPSGQPVRLEVDPAHAWMVGLVVEVRPRAMQGGAAPERGDARPATAQPTGAWAADARCTCPEFCERDHANE